MDSELKNLKVVKVGVRFDDASRKRLECLAEKSRITIADVIRILSNRALASDRQDWKSSKQDESVMAWKCSMRIEPNRREKFALLAKANGIGRGTLIRQMVLHELDQVGGDQL